MEIQNVAKNGVVTSAIKTYEELSDTEKQAIKLAYGSKIEDYATFQVTQNKKQENLRVSGHMASEARETELAERVDFVDALQVVYGKKGTKARSQAKKRVDSAKAKQAENKEILENGHVDVALIKKLFASDIADFTIEKETGVSRSTIGRIKNGQAKLENMTILNAIKLTRYAESLKL